MSHKLDAYAEGFLHTCYKAGLSEEQAVVSLVKSSMQRLVNHGIPLDNVSRRVFFDTAVLAGLPSTQPKP